MNFRTTWSLIDGQLSAKKERSADLFSRGYGRPVLLCESSSHNEKSSKIDPQKKNSIVDAYKTADFLEHINQHF